MTSSTRKSYALAEASFRFILILALIAIFLPSASFNMASAMASAASGQIAPAAAGDLDPTFGTDGMVVTSFITDSSGIDAMALQSDGKIIAVGGVQTDVGSDIAVVRYLDDGSLDATFGIGGKVITSALGHGVAHAVVIQTDGRIVVAGEQGSDYILLRYNTNGSLDTSFGSGGMFINDFGGSSGSGDVAYAVALQTDGKILIAGSANIGRGGRTRNFGLARYNSNGSIDTSFGAAGTVVTDFAGHFDEAYAIALQSDGKIVLGGVSSDFNYAPSGNFALARYTSNGSLDATFGMGGIVETDFFGTRDEVHALALQSDGKILAAGFAWSWATNTDFALVRYNTNGTLDSTFGASGKTTTDFYGVADGANAIAFQQDGKIVLAGYAVVGALLRRDFGLARYSSNGVLDSTFGLAGKVTTDIMGGEDFANSVLAMPDGRMLAGGVAAPGMLDETIGNFALACYQTTSIVDDFSISLDQQTLTVNRGTITPLNINIARNGSFTGKIRVLPPDTRSLGIVPRPFAAQKTKGNTVTYRLKVKLSASPGPYTLTFTGVDSSGRIRTTTLNLNVQ